MIKKAMALLTALTLALAAGGCGSSNQQLYERAQLYLGYGETRAARVLFDQLGEYEDSAEYALYCAGIEALCQGDVTLARANLEEVDPFKSSSRYLRYLDALELVEDDDLEGALTIWEGLGSFYDSADKAAEMREEIPENHLAHSEALMEAGRYEQALTELEALGGYGKSLDMIAQCRKAIAQAQYNQANAMYDAGNFGDALTAFEALGDTLDSRARVLLCRSAMYREAEAAYAAVTLDTAAELMDRYADLEDYLESALRLKDLKARYDVNLRVKAAQSPCVAYGSYPTGESGVSTGLTWHALSVDGGVATLLCDRVIDAMPLASATDLSLTLTPQEQAGFQSLSLPSMEELSALPEEQMRCPATPYALAQGVRHHADGSAWWWLRNALDNGRQMICWYNGTVLDTGVDPAERVVGVRPMVCLSLDKFAFTGGSGTAEDPFR